MYRYEYSMYCITVRLNYGEQLNYKLSKLMLEERVFTVIIECGRDK